MEANRQIHKHQKYFVVTLMIGVLCCLGTAGCGTSPTPDTTAANEDSAFLDDLFSDIDLTDAPVPETTGVQAESSEKADAITAIAMSTAKERLELQLSKGDRFPLIKTVEQTLVQKSELYPANARTRLELHMVIQVSDLRADAMLLDVRYGRIVYEREINGEQVRFDSAESQACVLPEVIPYSGMVNNGFAFWLGKDNRIREVVGFDEFVQRCLQRVPEQGRQTLMRGISGNFESDSVANFLDDSIGLLPYDVTVDPSAATRVSVGDVWTRERKLSQPVPITMSTTCRLLSLDDTSAKIDITGRVAADQNRGDASSARPVTVTGGRCMGACVIDRRTGLPLQVNRSCYLSMAVMTAAGEIVEQEKRIETTIRTQSEAGAPIVQSPSAATNGVVHADSGQSSTRRSIQQTSGNLAQPRQSDPTAGLSSTARAVYPD